MVLNTLVLWRVAYVEGYVAERHSLTIVLCSIPWAAAGLIELGERVVGWSKRMFPNRRVALNGAMCSTMLVAIVVLSGLPGSLAPLHYNRTGFRAAGVWLAQNAGPSDRIIDPFSWVEFYSGQTHRQVYDSQSSSAPESVYVVLGGSKNAHDRLPLIPEAKSWAQRGHVVYRWPQQPIRFKAEEVVVYRVP
jgi:hypothetical protein